jgi:hypothetical protein
MASSLSAVAMNDVAGLNGRRADRNEA